jgi:uncharacterized protein
VSNEVINETRREFLGTSALVLSGAVFGGSGTAAPHGASAQSHAVKQPAVIGYPNEKGVTIERITYPARNMGTTSSPISTSLPASMQRASTRRWS